MRVWYLLLVVPMLGTLIPPIYNTKDPTLIGIPFLLLVPDPLGAGHRRVHAHRLPLDEGETVMGGVNGVERRPSPASTSGGSAGRKFGSWISWFLIGGDLYTAYTFVAVPALVFGAGALGFFAVPPAGADATHPADYYVETCDPGVRPLPISAGRRRQRKGNLPMGYVPAAPRGLKAANQWYPHHAASR
jgi:hypothetical protein